MYLVQARRQEDKLAGGNGQLAGEVALSLLGLGVGTGRVTADADNVATANVDVLVLEAGDAFTQVVGLSEDLESGTLRMVSTVSGSGRVCLLVARTLERRS